MVEHKLAYLSLFIIATIFLTTVTIQQANATSLRDTIIQKICHNAFIQSHSQICKVINNNGGNTGGSVNGGVGGSGSGGALQ